MIREKNTKKEQTHDLWFFWALLSLVLVFGGAGLNFLFSSESSVFLQPTTEFYFSFDNPLLSNGEGTGQELEDREAGPFNGEVTHNIVQGDRIVVRGVDGRFYYAYVVDVSAVGAEFQINPPSENFVLVKSGELNGLDVDGDGFIDLEVSVTAFNPVEGDIVATVSPLIAPSDETPDSGGRAAGFVLLIISILLIVVIVFFYLLRVFTS